MSVRILLAEDDADDRMMFQEFLTQRVDITLMTMVENGEELMELLEKINDEQLPHVIVLDQNMPKRNGLQTLEALKRHNRFAHLPVIIYSTFIDQQLSEKSINAGAVAAITKPFSRSGYDEMIISILGFVS